MSKPTSKFLLKTFAACFVISITPPSLFAQRELAGAAATRLALERLRVCGSVLMIAAHPDDENTAVLAYLARGRKLDTAYLSLTRGEGGQNLIGPEQGERLGVIRTQELMDARRIDGARQFFTRAIDFGFTKTAEETLRKWGRERILGDIVWTIRRFRPDVIVLRFSGTSRDGHGQHQTSSILGKEAFYAAADPRQFPEQLSRVQPWQAKRLLWNAFAFTREQQQEAERMGGRVSVDTGEYDPVLGFSYSEIAAMSRSMHRSQAMGSPERKGSRRDYFVTIAGDAAKQDLLDGVDTSWRRVPGAEEVARLIEQAAAAFDPVRPERSLPYLRKARPLLAALRGVYPERKLAELDEAIALCAGLWADLTADRAMVVPGSRAGLTVSAIVRAPVQVQLEHIGWARSASPSRPDDIAPAAALSLNAPWSRSAAWTTAADEPVTPPYWLAHKPDGDVYRIPSAELIGEPENPPVLAATFRFRVEDTSIELTRPLLFRFVDRVYGERSRPVAVVPPVAVMMPENALVFPDPKPRRVDVGVRANAPAQSGTVRLSAPAGWTVEPESARFTLGETGEQASASFWLTPPGNGGRAILKGIAETGGRTVAVSIDVLDHPHIQAQTLLPAATTVVARADIRTLARRVGYVMGAGDEVPQALRQIGVETALIGQEELARGDLGRFDAIVTGVRAWNTRGDLRANAQRLWDYAKAGGTVVVQYNVLEGGFGGGDPKQLEHIGPFPVQISRQRVSVEDAPVRFPDPSLSVLNAPNQITAADFDGWVQERGLYFASGWDQRYRPVLESNDPDEKPLPGGTLFAPLGKGAYVFTAYSWFRQLPAGVPGAYRVFANFISAGKVLQGAR